MSSPDSEVAPVFVPCTLTLVPVITTRSANISFVGAATTCAPAQIKKTKTANQHFNPHNIRSNHGFYGLLAGIASHKVGAKILAGRRAN
jgi:hypothetical protein